MASSRTQPALHPTHTVAAGEYKGLPSKRTDSPCTIVDIADFFINYVGTLQKDFISLIKFFHHHTDRERPSRIHSHLASSVCRPKGSWVRGMYQSRRKGIARCRLPQNRCPCHVRVSSDAAFTREARFPRRRRIRRGTRTWLLSKR